MTKLLNVVIIVLALALVAVILYPQIQEARPKPVRFAVDSTTCCLPVLIGIEDSLFEQNRIIPELVFYADPEKALDGLFAGEYDVGIFPWSTVFKGMTARGETLKVYASGDFRSTLPVEALVVKTKSRIKDVAGLKKMKLGYPPQFRDYFAPFLIGANLPAELVTGVELPFSELVPRLRAGEIDAAWLVEPLICTLDSTEFRVLETGALPKYVSAPFTGAAIGFAPGFLETGKALLSRLKISTDAAIGVVDSRPERVRDVLEKYFPYLAGASAKCRVPEFQRLVEINKPAVSALASRLSVSGAIEGDIETRGIFVEPAKMTR